MSPEPNIDQQRLYLTIRQLFLIVLILVIALIGALAYIYNRQPKAAEDTNTISLSPVIDTKTGATYWEAPALSTISDPALLSVVEYGADLITHTAKYLGPEGSVLHISNGMNCQNCHLDRGTKIYGNNYGSVFSSYPALKPRSGKIESAIDRVNDCLKRSLNGQPLDANSKEMKSIIAYFNFLGAVVPKGKKAPGSGLMDLPLLTRPADPAKGEVLFSIRCQSCHQQNGQGQKNKGESEYIYPPLWGEHSYNDGAGLFRVAAFAKYVKYNMPKGTMFNAPVLSDEEAWDLAAYVNSQPRPHYDLSRDWPDISKKPFDYPFAPYADAFTANQHKYGPFQPIIDSQKKQAKK